MIAIAGVLLGGFVPRVMQVPEDAAESTRRYMTIIVAGMRIHVPGASPWSAAEVRSTLARSEQLSAAHPPFTLYVEITCS